MGSGIHAPLSGNKYILSTQPTQLSSHHSLLSADKRRKGPRQGTDIVVLAIYHLARSRSTLHARLSPSRDFHNREPSFSASPSIPVGFFSSSSARRELMYGSWLEWLYACTHVHTPKDEENSLCPKGVRSMRCPVRKTLQGDLSVRTRQVLRLFFFRLLMYQFRRIFNREKDIIVISWGARMDGSKKNS